VELDEVHRVDTQAFKRSVKAFSDTGRIALVGFGGQKEMLSMFGHPLADPQFRVAVAGGGIYVVDPIIEQKLENLV
jgi:hypothetical protein